MYNGIGLPTPRGSGTSGYIQKNLSHLKPRRTDFGKTELLENENEEGRLSQPVKLRKPNADLLDHERRRQVEIKLIGFVENLRREIDDEELIEEKVSEERERLLKLSETEKLVEPKSNISNIDTHQSAKLKEKELEKFRDAFNIQHSDNINSDEKRKNRNIVHENDPASKKKNQKYSERNRDKSSFPLEASHKTHPGSQIFDSSERSFLHDSNDIRYNSEFRSLSGNRLRRKSNMSSRHSPYRQSTFDDNRSLSNKRMRSHHHLNRSSSRNASRSLKTKLMAPDNSEFSSDNAPIETLETIRRYKRHGSQSSKKENKNSQFFPDKKKITSPSMETKLSSISQSRLASAFNLKKKSCNSFSPRSSSSSSFSSSSSSSSSKKRLVSYKTRGSEATNEDAKSDSVSCNYGNKSRVRKSLSKEALQKKRFGSTSNEKIIPISRSFTEDFKKGKTYNHDRQNTHNISYESMLTNEKITMRKTPKLKEKSKYRSISPNPKAGIVDRRSHYRHDSSRDINLSPQRTRTSTSCSSGRRKASTFFRSRIQRKRSISSIAPTRQKASKLSQSSIHRRSSTFSPSPKQQRNYNLSRSPLRRRESSLSRSHVQQRKSSFSRSPLLKKKSLLSRSPMQPRKSACSRSPLRHTKSTSSPRRKLISKSERNHLTSSHSLLRRSQCSSSSTSGSKRRSRHFSSSKRSYRRFYRSPSRSVKKKGYITGSTYRKSRTPRLKLHERRSNQSYLRSHSNKNKESYIQQQLTNRKCSTSASVKQRPKSFDSCSSQNTTSQASFKSPSLHRNRTSSRSKERSHQHFTNSCGSSQSKVLKHTRLSSNHKETSLPRVKTSRKKFFISSSPPRKRKCSTSRSSLPRRKLSISRSRRSRTKISNSRLPSRKRNLSISMSTSERSEMNVPKSTVRQTSKAASSSHASQQKISISSPYYRRKISSRHLNKEELYSKQDDKKFGIPHSSYYSKKCESPDSTGRSRRSSISHSFSKES